MRRFLVLLLVFGLVSTGAIAAFSDEPKENDRYADYCYGWGHGHMMGYGSDWGQGHMMGRGYGMWGMHGRGRGWDDRPRGLQSMKPEERQKWENMRNNFLKETLKLRQDLAVKQMELQTLWAQDNVDQTRVEKLSGEVAELRAELSTKRDKYLVECRKEFGDQGWNCPGGMW